MSRRLRLPLILGASLAWLLFFGTLGCSRRILVPETGATAPAGFPAHSYETATAGHDRVYRVDPLATSLQIRVAPGGRLARFGHTHLITSHDVRGYVLLAEAREQSRADLYIPVASLVVDAPEERAAAGAQFAAPVDEAAAQATRGNLLSAAVLDAARFPHVLVGIRVAAAQDKKLDLVLTIRIRGVTRQVACPILLELKRDELVGIGAVELRQSDFGITPFSTLLGALTVQDPLHLTIRLTARPYLPAPES